MGKGVRGVGVWVCVMYMENGVGQLVEGHDIVEGDTEVRWGTLSVTVTSAPSTSTGTVSTGGLAALSVE